MMSPQKKNFSQHEPLPCSITTINVPITAALSPSIFSSLTPNLVLQFYPIGATFAVSPRRFPIQIYLRPPFAAPGSVRYLMSGSHLVSLVWHTSLLKIIGVGFKIRLFAKYLYFDLGRSHSLFLPLPRGIWAGIGYPTKRNFFSLKSAYPSLLLTTISRIQQFRYPDVYRGKGVQIRGYIYRFRPGKKKGH